MNIYSNFEDMFHTVRYTDWIKRSNLTLCRPPCALHSLQVTLQTLHARHFARRPELVPGCGLLALVLRVVNLLGQGPDILGVKCRVRIRHLVTRVRGRGPQLCRAQLLLARKGDSGRVSRCGGVGGGSGASPHRSCPPHLLRGHNRFVAHHPPAAGAPGPTALRPHRPARPRRIDLARSSCRRGRGGSGADPPPTRSW